MFGYDYISQHIEAYEREKAFKVYLTDGLKTLTENTANYAGGKSLNVRFFDLFKEVKEENPQKIISRITSKLRSTGGER